jgi:hypothetical protein
MPNPKNYRPAWEELPECAGWLEDKKGDAYCPVRN